MWVPVAVCQPCELLYTCYLLPAGYDLPSDVKQWQWRWLTEPAGQRVHGSRCWQCSWYDCGRGSVAVESRGQRTCCLSLWSARYDAGHCNSTISTLLTTASLKLLVAWHRGRTSVSDWRTFPVLRSTCSWWVTTNVGKLSATGQPTRPTQPFIPSGVK